MNKGGGLPIALFNGVVATTNGTYHIDDISIEEAKQLIEECGYLSAIGHQATAEVMSKLLGIHIEMNRIQFVQEAGQKAIVLKLKERPPEGKILSLEEMEEIGYSLKIMTRID